MVEDPIIKVFTPANGSHVKGTINVNVQAIDNKAVTKIELYIGGVKVSESNCDILDFSFDTTVFSDGNIEIEAFAYDADGNSVSKLNTIFLDNSAPLITGFSPDGGSFEDSVDVTVNVDDSSSTIYCTTDGSNPVVGTNAGSVVTLDSEGTYTIKCISVDTVGNVSDVKESCQFEITKSQWVPKAYTSTNVEHVNSGRAEIHHPLTPYIDYAKTIGTGDDLGMLGTQYYSTITTVCEYEEAKFKKVNSESECGSTNPGEKPEIDVTAPTAGATVAKNGTVQVTGTSDKADSIKVQLVGGNSGNVYYTEDLTTGLENWSVQLSTTVTWSGSYKVLVTATNDKGTTTKEVSITIQ